MDDKTDELRRLIVVCIDVPLPKPDLRPEPAAEPRKPCSRNLGKGGFLLVGVGSNGCEQSVSSEGEEEDDDGDGDEEEVGEEGDAEEEGGLSGLRLLRPRGRAVVSVDTTTTINAALLTRLFFTVHHQ